MLQKVEPQRVGHELLAATREFAVESKLRSWWAVGSTLILLVGTLTLAGLAPWWPLRVASSVVGGLLIVRSFILYHDVMHGALLRKSRLAKMGFYVLGLMLLTSPKYWRQSHNFHHGNVAKPLEDDGVPAQLVASDVGSFPLMTTDTWKKTPFWARLKYRICRNPLTLLFAYVTVFAFGLCIVPIVEKPRGYWDGALALLTHGSMVAALWIFGGFWIAFFCLLLPFTIAAAVGAYLFYAQHNYEDMQVLEPSEWTYFRGALESSSYMRLSKLMHWFTGNIGYHHVHHLNPLIPFYRLPEALAAVPELQHVGTTSLSISKVAGCLRLNLWDPKKQKLVSFKDA